MPQFCYLVPIVQQTINGQSVNVPKYLGTDFTGDFSSILFGLEPLTLLTLPRASSALQGEPDIFAFNPDLTTAMSDEDAATLDGFLNANNLPSDGITSGLPFVTALIYVLRIHLLGSYIAGQTGSDLFTPAVQSASLGVGVSTNIGVAGAGDSGSSPSTLGLSDLFSLSGAAAILTVQANPTQSQQSMQGGLGNQTPAPLFDFSNVGDGDTIGDVLDSVSQTWAGPISLGGFA